MIQKIQRRFSILANDTFSSFGQVQKMCLGMKLARAQASVRCRSQETENSMIEIGTVNISGNVKLNS